MRRSTTRPSRLPLKIPLCSFNNTFNSWFTFVKPPTYPHPDLTPDWTPTTPTPTFFIFEISSIRGAHTPNPHPITPSTFQFYNGFKSWITSTRQPPNFYFQFHNKFNSWFTSTRPPPPPPPYSENDFHKGYLFRSAPRF